MMYQSWMVTIKVPDGATLRETEDALHRQIEIGHEIIEMHLLASRSEKNFRKEVKGK